MADVSHDNYRQQYYYQETIFACLMSRDNIQIIHKTLPIWPFNHYLGIPTQKGGLYIESGPWARLDRIPHITDKNGK